MLSFLKKKDDEKKNSVVDTIGKLLLGGTAKLANTVAAGSSGVGDVAKVLTARATGNKEAERNTLRDSDKNMNRFLEKGGGLFGAGGFVDNADQAGNLSAGDVAKKSFGGGLEVASEIVPVGRGVSVASKGGKFAKALTEGAVTAGGGSVGSQLSEDGKVDAKQTIQDTLIGTLMAGGGYGLSKTGKAIKETAPTFRDTVKSQVGEGTPGQSKQGGYIRLPGKGETPDAIAPDGKGRIEIDDSKAKVAVPSSHKNAPEDLKLTHVLKHDDLFKDFPDLQDVNVKFVNFKDKSINGGISKNDANTIYINKKHDNEQSKGMLKKTLLHEVQHMIQTKQDLPSGTNSKEGGVAAYRNDPGEVEAHAVGDRAELSPTERLQNPISTIQGNRPVDQAKAALTGENQQFDDLESTGGRIVSQSNVDTPRTGRTVKTVDRAKSALLGAENDSKSVKTNADIARESLPGAVGEKLDDDVIDLLGKTGKDKDSAAKAPVLEGARDPASVLSRSHGSVGSDIVNDSAIAFKRRSDLQDNAAGLIDDAQKKLKKAAKTDVGRADLEKRINNALEDRANSDSYFKNDKEKEVYESTKKFYDYYQGELQLAGKGTLENYSPRVARKSAADAADNLDYTLDKAFSKNTDAKFLKERVNKDESEIENLDSPISIMKNYSSSVSKQLAYEDMMKELPGKLKSTKAVYRTDQGTNVQSDAYLQKYLKDQLQPDVPTTGKGLGKLISEKAQNKLISNTYSAALKFSPKYYLMNRSQGFATKSQVSSEATKLVRLMKKDPEWKELSKGLTTGENTVGAEAKGNNQNLGRPKSKLDKLDAKFSAEQSNVAHSFNAGVAENIVRSKQYKAFRKEGMKPAKAAKATLADESFNKDLAVRHGNVVTNTTQFGGNVANKPGWLRDSGTVLGFSKKWYQQYQRFPLGMMQMLGNITDPKTARAVDIMRRGDPLQTKLVDYQKAVKILSNALPEAKKAVKAGDSTVSPEKIKQSEKLLKDLQKTLDKEIKANSSIRRGKTAKNVTKMWAASSMIQYLFSEISGTNDDKSTAGKVGNAIKYGAPVNVPSKEQNPLTGPVAPSIPVDKSGISERKLLNFIPVVGPLVNRGRDVKNFVGALTGE